MRAIVVLHPDLQALFHRVKAGESLTLAEQEELLGVAADLLARIQVLEERSAEPLDRRAA